MACALRKTITSSPNGIALFHSCKLLCKENQWRRAQGLPEQLNRTPRLLEGPDYSFVDGRPTPLGSHQHERLLRQRELAATAVQLIKEVDHAIEYHQNKEKRQLQERQLILDSKLKPKGNSLTSKQK